MKPLLLVALLGCLATVLTSPAAPPEKVRWCLKSEQEYQKCSSLAAKAPALSCVREISKDCISAIKDGEADAITLDGGEIYTAGLPNYDLHPIIAEDYGTSFDVCYFAVAVVKKGSGFGIRDLRGKKSCHTGPWKSPGMDIPMGTLVSMDIVQREDTENINADWAASEFFQASCVPGTPSIRKLCQLCRGDCSESHEEPYYGFSGAFQCLKDGAGDVAFVNHLTVPDSEKEKYELLCKDNTRAPIDSYERCHWARAPGHAVVSRKDPQLAELIWTTLSSLSSTDLFTSVNGKDLIFSDSTKKLVKVPPNTDSFLYLGAEYMRIISSLEKVPRISTPTSITWCAVGHDEMTKCDAWYSNSVTRDDSDYIMAIDCEMANTFDDCLKKIMLKEADAVAVDGGQVYTAGKCGLVPVMVEQYDEAHCNSSLGSPLYPFWSVAVVKKGSGVTWNNLKGKRSCHTGINTSAGWNIPMGLIYNMTNDCDFTKFFSSGCAPGSDPSSPFCTQCVGSGRALEDENKCAANANEQYYGYAGAFRCLVDGEGDVAFVKHTTPTENSDGKGPDWARNVNSADYELICPGRSSPVPVSDFASCNLGRVPGHAVVTRPESRRKVVQILNEQQAKFGNHGSDPTFRMFQSEGGRNLLFQDSTKCLHEIPAEKNYEQFLGQDYISAMNSLRQCSKSTPDVEKSCTFYSC